MPKTNTGIEYRDVKQFINIVPNDDVVPADNPIAQRFKKAQRIAQQALELSRTAKMPYSKQQLMQYARLVGEAHYLDEKILNIGEIEGEPMYDKTVELLGTNFILDDIILAHFQIFQNQALIARGSLVKDNPALTAMMQRLLDHQMQHLRLLIDLYPKEYHLVMQLAATLRIAGKEIEAHKELRKTCDLLFSNGQHQTLLAPGARAFEIPFILATTAYNLCDYVQKGTLKLAPEFLQVVNQETLKLGHLYLVELPKLYPWILYSKNYSTCCFIVAMDTIKRGLPSNRATGYREIARTAPKQVLEAAEYVKLGLQYDNTWKRTALLSDMTCDSAVWATSKKQILVLFQEMLASGGLSVEQWKEWGFPMLCRNFNCKNFLEMRQVPVKKCSKCRRVAYCCRECQLADWKQHKPDCVPYEAADKSKTSTEQSSSSSNNSTAVDVSKMSVSQLKEYLTSAGVDHSNCIEKADLQALAKRHSQK